MRVGFWLAGLAAAVSACAQTEPTTLRGAAAGIPLLVGAAADGSDENPDPLATDVAYTSTLAAQFNMLEAENAMKWGPLHPNPPGSPNEYNFAAGDELVRFAQANGMWVRGHNLLWHSYNPTWLTSGGYNSTQLYTILQNHITTVVNHYKGQVFAWDVVNEALDDNTGALRDSIWYNQPGIGLTGTGYIEQAFRWAHAADPNALLFYNEYSIEDQYCSNAVSYGDGTKFPAMYAMVADFVARGVPINGVGFQMHIDIGGCPTSAVLARHIQRITALGLAVHITEMDVKIPDTSAASLQAQAQTYQRILNVCLQNPGCTAFQTWGFTDRHTWLPAGFPLPFDSDYQPKPAFAALLNTLNAAPPPPASSCTYSLNRTTVEISGAGGSAPIAVTTWPACIWTVAGLPDWIASPASGKGATTATLTFAANPGAARTATVTVAGTSVTVSQEAACTYTVDTLSTGFSLAGGSATIPIATGSGCPWSASSTLDWVSFTGSASGAGDGSVTIQAARDAGAARSGIITIAGQPVTISEGALRFVPVAPCRVADTRTAAGPFGGPAMTASSTRSFAIPQSGCGIPATAQAYSLNVTVVPPAPLSYLTLWPAGQPQPLVSTLNAFQGQVVANAAIVPAGDLGAVNVFVTHPTDVILDINGYFDSPSPGSYSFYPVSPCRIADTRATAGPFGGPTMTAGQSRDFAILSSSCSIPSVPSAYSLNVTAVPAGYLGFLTTWPAGDARPLVSTLNSWTGKVVANAALVPAGNAGSVSVYVSDPADVVLDIDGYFGRIGNPGALSFYPLAPCRVADTRDDDGPLGGPILEADAARSFPIASGRCGVPTSAAAYSMNVTVVPGGILPYLTAWPSGSPKPLVSTLNSFDGTVAANAAIVPAGANGAVSIYVAGRTHVILDIDGYFAP
jgi:endo-1,4-beta-xylanase